MSLSGLGGGEGSGRVAGSIYRKDQVHGRRSKEQEKCGDTVITPGLPFVGRPLIALEYMKVMVYLRRRKWEVLDMESGTQGNGGNNLLKTEHSKGTWEYWR